MNVLGIDIDGKVANISLLDANKRIKDLKSLDIKNVKQLYIKNKNISNKNFIATSVFSNKVLIKEKKSPITDKKRLKKSISIQASTITALNEEECLIQSILTKHSNTLTINFYITTCKALISHLDSYKQNGFESDFVLSNMHALSRFAAYNFPKIESLFVLHIGRTFIELIEIQNRAPINSYVINFGKHDFSNAFKKDKKKNESLGNLSFLTNEKTPSLQKLIQNLTNELKNAFLSFKKQKLLAPTMPIFITGEIKGLADFDVYIKENFSNYFSNILEIKQVETLPYAISMGSALDVVASDENSIQFRQKQLIPKKHIKKAGIKLSFFILLSFIFCATTLFIGNQFLKEKEKILISKTNDLIKKNDLTDILASGEHITKSNIDYALNKTRKKIKLNSTIPFYASNNISLSKILQNLNENILIKNKEILIHSINYELEQYPIISKQNVHHIGKIDIIYSVSNNNASNDSSYQKFKAFLKKECNFIDSSKKITFIDLEKGDKKVSFYLKRGAFNEK